VATVRRRKGSEYYYADFRDAAGARRQPCTYRTRKGDAQDVADRWERESLRDPLEAERERATWGDALDLLAGHLLESVRAGRMAHDTALMHRAKAVQLTKVFGRGKKLATVNTAAVRDYCAERRRPRVEELKSGRARHRPPVRDHTLVKEIVTLRLAMRLAAERGWWRGDLDTLKPAEVSSDYAPRERVVSAAEVDALRAQLGPRKHAKRPRWRVVAFALATGAEFSAWSRFRRDLDVVTTRSTDGAEPVTLVRVRGSKRETRDRWVPVVLPECQALLREALDGPDEAPPHTFRPWTRAGHALALACERAKVPHVTPTDLRRTWATRHIEAGVSLDVLFRAAGHVDTTMLARTYAKPRVEVQAELMREQITRKGTKKT